ncbi:MAG: polysaccharide deacetylase family protein, partial [Selenomonadaceae bacterium]|nr:polysaccharide deacetylase family protein [Selenomonadaceae bacterium]
EEVEQLTKDTGYRGAFTVNYGLTSPEEQRFIMDRIPIFGCNSHTFLRFKTRLVLAPILAHLNTWKNRLQKDGHTRLASLILIP